MNQVPLTTLIARVRRRCNIGGATSFITDAEICDELNGSLATELHDMVRQSVGDQYWRKSYTFITNNTQADPSTYDLPLDFLDAISVDCYLGTTIGANQPKISARRYMEEERNVYSFLPFGWFYGGWILYSLVGNQIRFQPMPGASYAIGLNYQPTSVQLSTANPNVGYDDINGWSECAVLDTASKCAVKMNRLDLAAYLDQKKEKLQAKIRSVVAMRHSGEPERPHFFSRPDYGDGWEPYG